MDRMEFIDRLQRALSGGVNSSQVAENTRYYQEYIDMEMRKGKSEEEVLERLGDPKLLARSIIEANKRAGITEGTNQNYDEEAPEDVYGENFGVKQIVRMPRWLIILIAVVVVLLIIGVLFSLISVLAPIMIPVLIIVLVVNYVKSR